MSRSLVEIAQLSGDDVREICALAQAPVVGTEFAGERVSLLFELPSLRTRAAAVAAVQELGGWSSAFSGPEVGLDERESAEDVARTLLVTSGYAGLRVRDHGVFARMAAATNGELALVNLLSDHEHPTEAIGDVLTLADHFADGVVEDLGGRTVAYVGDANNVARSLAEVLVRVGVVVRLGAPPSRQLPVRDVAAINARAEGGGSLTQVSSAAVAVRGADAVYTDVWLSMGDPDDQAARAQELAPFQLSEDLLALAAPHAVALHCLPAHRGQEITASVLESDRCLAWAQARRRTSAIVGALRWMKGRP